MSSARELQIEYSNQVPGELTGVLAVVCPAAGVGGVSSPLRIDLPMAPLGGARAEVWRSALPIERGVTGPIVWSRAGDFLVGAMPAGDQGPLAQRATEAYRTIVSFVRDSGFGNIVRMWNHVPRILVHDGGIERYQTFCAGRAAGFEAEGFTLDGDLPAASAVGGDGDGFVVVVLASRRKAAYVENPRQVSAFHYPPEYGPRSPSFARASRVAADGGSMIFVSGTASIVGHRSVHLGDPAAQVDETVENLRLVFGAAAGRQIAGLRDVAGALYRIYVKRDADLAVIRERLGRNIADDATCLWLRADICRDELLVEIEMIGRI